MSPPIADHCTTVVPTIDREEAGAFVVGREVLDELANPAPMGSARPRREGLRAHHPS
jgi:hypothetical protein